jgi:hypothetical protein
LTVFGVYQIGMRRPVSTGCMMAYNKGFLENLGLGVLLVVP